MSIIKAINSKKSIDYIANLLQNGSDINETDYKGNTALHLAIKNRNFLLIYVLLIDKPDIDKKNVYDMTPLRSAVEMQSVELVNLMVDAGANLEVRTGITHDTVLYIAIKHKLSYDIIYVLISNGADLYTKSYYGKELLIYAIDSRRIDVIKLLFDNGADITTVSECKFIFTDDKKKYIEIQECLKNQYILIQTNLYKKLAQHLISYPHHLESISLSILQEKLINLKKTKYPLQYHQQFNILTEIKERY